MKTYKVLFWWHLHKVNPFIAPNKVVEVTTDAKDDRDVVRLALAKVGKYPKTYSVQVQDITEESVEYVKLSDVEKLLELIERRDRFLEHSYHYALRDSEIKKQWDLTKADSLFIRSR